MRTQSGIILIDKQPGMTSFASLSVLKRALGTDKIGHTGTLDSFASGLLVVLAGNLTRLASVVTHLDKTYRARITFGSETNTLDPLGTIIEQSALPEPVALSEAVTRFTGAYMQEPPVYSAIKIDGKRASDMARAGKNIVIQKREVTIHDIVIENVELSGACVESADIIVTCTAGTYIRSLARDIARACGSRAYLSALRRTRVGTFCVEDAAPAENSADALIPFSADTAKKCGLWALTLASSYENNFFNGQPLCASWFAEDSVLIEGDPAAIFLEDGTFAGVITAKEGGRLSYAFVSQREKIHA
jgi:tRNA pseudouridine55 synthase